MNYNVLSDDIIRFADKKNLNKFTLLGHGLGGRAAMTAACRYPDRIDGVISLDVAPVNGSARRNEFGRRQLQILKFMKDMHKWEGITRQEAITKVQFKYRQSLIFQELVI